MTEPILNVMKVMLLAGLYLFFFRVLWAITSDLRDPRIRTARKHARLANSPNSQPNQRAIATQQPQQPQHYGQQGHISPGSLVTPTSHQSTTLVIIEPIELSGVTFTVGSEATIGRDPQCTIQIEDTFISSTHARLFLRDGLCYLEDLGSRNGTLINGERVEATTVLKPRDQITVGATTMELR